MVRIVALEANVSKHTTVYINIKSHLQFPVYEYKTHVEWISSPIQACLTFCCNFFLTTTCYDSKLLHHVNLHFVYVCYPMRSRKMISKCIERVVCSNCTFHMALSGTLRPQQQTKSVKEIRWTVIKMWITDRWRFLALVNNVDLMLELEDIRGSPKSKGDCHNTTDSRISIYSNWTNVTDSRKILINCIYIYIYISKKERVHCLEGKLYWGFLLRRPVQM